MPAVPLSFLQLQCLLLSYNNMLAKPQYFIGGIFYFLYHLRMLRFTIGGASAAVILQQHSGLSAIHIFDFFPLFL